MTETTILGYVPINKDGDTMLGDLILNADPTDPLGAATKDYVDNASGGGGGTLAPVLAANTVAYTAIYDNGVSGVGATLTNDDTLAAFSIDGLAGELNGRYLIRVANSNAHHGIYTLTTVGDGATPWVLTRSEDFDTSAKMAIGTTVFSAGWNTFYLWGFMLGNSVATVGASGIDFYSIAAPIYTLPAVPVNGFQDMAFQDSGNLTVNLISDTDSSYTLGDASYRWNALFVNEIRNGTTNGDAIAISARDTANSLYLPFLKATAGAPPTCTLGAYDLDGAAYVPFVTLTSGNTPTCVLANGVTATTQAASDNSTKVATTAYVDAAASSGGGITLLSSASASASASLNLTSGITSTYDAYTIKMCGLVPATDAVTPWVRVSTDGGSTYVSSGTPYTYTIAGEGTGTTASTGANQMLMRASGGTMGNAAGESMSGDLEFFNPSSSALYKQFKSHITFADTAGNVSVCSIGSMNYKATTAINAVQVLMSSGNITSGAVYLYAYKKV